MSTILIVDDLLANRQVLMTLLHPLGHRMLEATNGSEGLAAVRADHPDLVITDVLMPVMDGYEFVRQMRLNPATSTIPVVFYTAHYGEREAREMALSSGASDVLTKPIASGEVLRVVGRLLGGESQPSTPSAGSPLATEFDREHLRLLTNAGPEQLEDLRIANARLRALVNIGLELAPERDPARMFQRVCAAARELFGATYVTLGIVHLTDRTVQRVVTCGTDAAEWIKTGDAVSGVLGTVVAERRTRRGHNRAGDRSGLGFPLLHPEVQAFLAAPIVSPGHVYGWICLVGNEGRAFTEDDEHLIMALSAQVGRIYENLSFSVVAQEHATELEREIRERKEAELALRHERDQAQRYLDAAEVILLALDLDGRITLINRNGCDLLGWTEHELLGLDWIATCLPARFREAVTKSFRRLIGGGDLSIVENAIVTRSGEERLIEWRNTVLRDDAGVISGTLSSGADITERHQSAEALRVADQRMGFVLQNANVGIWDIDYSTGVLRWSETLEAQYGLQPGTFNETFEGFVERIHPDDRASVLETMRKAMASGSDFSMLHRTIRPDGQVRWLNGAGRILLGDGGAPLRGVGISQDVTERRTLEEQFQQAQKMEALGSLAAGVAHDFNNLLTVILGFCELLLADLDPTDRRQSDIMEIQKAGERAARLTRQLLAFSRRELIEPTLLDLNVLVADIRVLLGRLIGDNVNVVLGLGRRLSPVKADRGQVEQILLNLAVNARDAMPKGGTLTIETTNVEPDEYRAKAHAAGTPGPYVAITVTDTGTGMTPEVQTHLFEPFFTTKGVGKGTGLGLATVHGIATRSGGSVTVESEVGRGTSFTVYFPRAEAAALDVAASAPMAPPRAGMHTILVVEDAEGLLVLTKRLLERQGYTVLVASNADDARQLFDGNPSIDLLLTDVMMPETSGPELVMQLLKRRPELKVLYMSGYTDEAIVDHGVLNPGIAFLQKPFSSETLGRKIREVLGSQQKDPQPAMTAN